MKAQDLPLPDHAHVPGHNVRHREGFLDHIIEQAPAETSNATVADNMVWAFGLRLLEQAYYWEAHEVLEQVWMRARPNSREKHLAQALIHIANAALKVKMRRATAAHRLADLAAASLREAYAGQVDTPVMDLVYANMNDMAQACATDPFIFKVN